MFTCLYQTLSLSSTHVLIAIVLLYNVLIFIFTVYKYPYMLGFTDNAVEIRTASNGSLVRNIVAANLRLISYKVEVTSSNAENKMY